MVLINSGDLGLKGQQLGFYTEGAIAMIAGGLSAQLTGGNFQDGAVQAGVVFLYNSSYWKNRAAGKPLTVEDAVKMQNTHAKALEKAFGSSATYNSTGRMTKTQAEIDAESQMFIGGVSSIATGGITGITAKLVGKEAGAFVMDKVRMTYWNNAYHTDNITKFIHGYSVEGPVNNIPGAIGAGVSKSLDYLLK